MLAPVTFLPALSFAFVVVPFGFSGALALGFCLRWWSTTVGASPAGGDEVLGAGAVAVGAVAVGTVEVGALEGVV